MSSPKFDLQLYLDRFRACVVQDALNEATATYWQRRADQLAAVGTPDCDHVARLCRHRASLAPIQSGPEPDVLAVLADADHQPGHDFPDAA